MHYMRVNSYCWYSNDPEYSITEAYSYDKPAMLEKWWELLSFEDKQKYLTHTWLLLVD